MIRGRALAGPLLCQTTAAPSYNCLFGGNIVETICSASGWWVLYKDNTRQRVAAFTSTEMGYYPLVAEGSELVFTGPGQVERIVHEDDAGPAFGKYRLL